MHEADVVAQFVDAMASHGISVQPSDIIADGLFHRVYVAGDKKGSRNAWYKLVIDQKPAGMFGDNKRLGHLTKIRWTAQGVVQMTPEERIAMRKKMRAAKLAKEQADREKEQKAAKRATTLWDSAPDAVEHPYLQRKGIKAHGARIAPWKSVNDEGEFYTVTDNALILQLRDLEKNVWSLQAIFPEKVTIGGVLRDKTYLYGGRKLGVFYTIGRPVENVILICEGFATGASLHEATGHAVIVTFDTSNLAAVARVFRQRFPDFVIVMCADNDRWTTKPVTNPGVHFARAAAAEVNGLVAIPDFVSLDGEPTDFNDLHQREGADAGKEDPPAAITIRDRSRRQEQGRKAQHIGADHPFHFGKACAELPRDRRQHDGDDIGVEDRQGAAGRCRKKDGQRTAGSVRSQGVGRHQATRNVMSS